MGLVLLPTMLSEEVPEMAKTVYRIVSNCACNTQPVNFVLQRSARSKPCVVHADKLKKYHGPTPHRWLHSVSEGAVMPEQDIDDSIKPTQVMSTITTAATEASNAYRSL